jgi:ubiquinone/menaquinone biosynthesis C-methylase UbiE
MRMSEAESYYNEKASVYDDVFSLLYFKIYDAVTWKYLEPYVPTRTEALVLDAGGGTGRWTVRMAKKGCKVVLVDDSDGMLKVARDKVKKEGLQDRVIIRKGDIKKLDYADQTFDLILCEHTLFVFEEPTAAIKEFARVLKMGAPLVISAQNLYVQLLMHLPYREIAQPEKLNEVLALLQRARYDRMTKNGRVKIYTWTPDEFRSLLVGNGFKIEKIVGKGMTTPLRMSEEPIMKKEYPDDLLNRMLQLEFALCERPDALALAAHLQAIARKT